MVLAASPSANSPAKCLTLCSDPARAAELRRLLADCENSMRRTVIREQIAQLEMRFFYIRSAGFVRIIGAEKHSDLLHGFNPIARAVVAAENMTAKDFFKTEWQIQPRNKPSSKVLTMGMSSHKACSLTDPVYGVVWVPHTTPHARAVIITPPETVLRKQREARLLQAAR